LILGLIFSSSPILARMYCYDPLPETQRRVLIRISLHLLNSQERIDHGGESTAYSFETLLIMFFQNSFDGPRVSELPMSKATTSQRCLPTRSPNSQVLVPKQASLKLITTAPRQNVPIKLTALINDTTGTLIASNYVDPDTKIAVIFGTGCNAAYMETAGNIPKMKHLGLPDDQEMAINVSEFLMIHRSFADQGYFAV
jgi:hypothetical protein